jgi:hypothetical protein
LISIILYGRNDAHGYNLHRRAALSLNCLAEGLTDPDDEIIFVDYNTPDELPTFIEAISDTLTDRCLGLLRLFRVPAAIHYQRFAEKTHLLAIEPVSRNAGVRRANPSNRWLLSTNTDMVLMPLEDASLSELCGDLPDGFYGLPRFELPEWLWERLPRTEPRAALADLKRLGSALRLDEPTVSHEWIRFDAPGDFQLLLREDFTAIDGFNEEMLLGYHVDSNLSRRMYLHRGSIESLGERLAGYHCNHNRVPTAYHGARLISNDLERFFYAVDQAVLPEQREIWGLANTTLEEVPIQQRVGVQVAERVGAAIPSTAGRRGSSSALEAVLGLTYDSGHVLPFIADSLVVSPTATRVAYIGANSTLGQMLAALVAELGLDEPLVAADLEDPTSLDRIELNTDVFVVDLGVDESNTDAPAPETDYESVEFPRGLALVLAALERLIERERVRLGRGEHPRRVVLVNSATAFWDGYVLAHFDCSHTSVHSRVRRATVKPVADSDETTKAAHEFALQLIRWGCRRHAGDGRLHIRPDARITITEQETYEGFGRGWAQPDNLGIWTKGRRSELSVALDAPDGYPVLAVAVGAICVEPEGLLRVELLADGERVAGHDFSQDLWESALPLVRRPLWPRVVEGAKTVMPDAVIDRLRPLYSRVTATAAAHAAVSRLKEFVWRVELPPGVVARRNVQLTFVIDEPRTPRALGWSDDERELGIHLRALALEDRDHATAETSVTASTHS